LALDAFTLIAEVIESQKKPSQSYGNIAQSAFLTRLSSEVILRSPGKVIPLRNLIFSRFLSSFSAYSGDTELILTADLKEKKAKEQFDCGDKVHLYAMLRNIPAGTHEAMAEWFIPKGKLQEVSTHKFVTKGEDYALWLWLELAPDTVGDLFGSVVPSLGMEGFIGRWKVRFYMDDEFVAEKIFFVIC